MQKKTLTLRNAGPNGDSAPDLYADALEILRTAREEAMRTQDTAADAAAASIAEALAILSTELQPV